MIGVIFIETGRAICLCVINDISAGKEPKMPNYANQEDELLSGPEKTMSASSRHPAITELKNEELLKLISNLEAAFSGAGARGASGNLTRADLLNAALRRAKTERRNRGLTSRSGGATKAVINKAGGTAKKPAPAAKAPAASKQRARTVARKVTDRIPTQARKPDQRTASHPVAPKPAVTMNIAENSKPTAKADKPLNKPEEDAIKAAKKAARKAAKKAARQFEKQTEKDALKAAKQAKKQSEKEARKAARKAAKKTEKEAEIAIRKAAKAAEREAKKAARKAINKAERKNAEANNAEKSGKKNKS